MMSPNLLIIINELDLSIMVLRQHQEDTDFSLLVIMFNLVEF